MRLLLNPPRKKFGGERPIWEKGKKLCLSKLYVGNLSFETSSEELKALFAQAGTVESVSLIEDRETGRSRGFGFVEMSTKEEGAAAIQKFNGTDLGGTGTERQRSQAPRRSRRRWRRWSQRRLALLIHGSRITATIKAPGGIFSPGALSLLHRSQTFIDGETIKYSSAVRRGGMMLDEYRAS